MRSPRQTKIRRALLQALESVPADLLLPEDLLRAEASRLILPRPTTTELDAEIHAADAARLMSGVQGEDDKKWKLSEAGKVWLAQNL